MSDTSLPSLLVRLWRHLSRRRQIQLGILLVIMVLSAFCEMISLGAVLPFIGILTAPEKVFNYPFVQQIARWLELTNPTQLIFPMTLAFVSAALIAGATRLTMLWVSARLAFAAGADLSIEVYRRTLYQPYKVHLERNSSDVINGVTNKTWNVAYLIQYVLTLLSSMTILIFLLLTLTIIDPLVISIAGIVFVSNYGLVTLVCRKNLASNSETIARESTEVVKTLQEALGGIRDVLLNGAQKVYCETYRRSDLPYRRAVGSTIFIATSPRFVMEAIGMAMIGVLAYGLSANGSNVSGSLPILAALALGAQRILPLVQLVFSSWVSILGSKNSLLDVLMLLDQPLPMEALLPEPEPMEFNKEIALHEVSFRYSEDGPWVLKDVNLVISKGSRVGFVGTTGSGKTTLLDLLMGLLEPTEGAIIVDGIPITAQNRRSWQRSIAHVPQSIFLTDSTIAENIAFGIPREQIDMKNIRNVAHQAHLSEFVEGLTEGYRTVVGERGIRLSGGQRQRIGIARALYRDASVLTFDEATSALDNSTEQAVMEAISSLNRDLTILLIAHRLTTVQTCDTIVELENGRIVALGSYNELLRSSSGFQKMALGIHEQRSTNVTEASAANSQIGH